MDSGGFMKGIFSYIADNHTLLNISDAANAWGLTLIGLALMLGLFARYASLAGIFLLLLYYLSHPAFPGIDYMFPSDGSYFIINKTLVELFAMLVIFAFPSSGQFGIERFIHKKQQ
jgi:thiosulfate dehydrogenase [quinone] large subunit